MDVSEPEQEPQNKSGLSLDLVHETWVIFRQAGGPMNAAAMAHFALLSMIPFMIVAAGVVNFFVEPEAAVSSSGPIGHSESYEAVARPVRHLLPFIDEGLAVQVRALVRDYQSTGFVSVFVLFLTAALFFSALETSVKRVFSVRTRRVWVAKTRVVGFIVSILVLLALGSYAWGGIEIAESSGFGPLISALIVALGFNLVIFWFASFRTRPRFVAAGALLMCVLWTMAHFAFQYYLENVAKLSELYGALSGIAILMVWIYYAALIFLFSCAFVQALNLSSTLQNEAKSLE